MRIPVAGFLLGIVLLNAGPAVSAGLESLCDLQSGTAVSLSDKNFRITYKTDPISPSVSEPFVLHMLICTEAGIPYEGRLKLNASMPKHKHGMNFTPKVTQLSPGSFQAEGMMFHMPGTWRYEFSLRRDGKTEQMVSDFLLK